MADTSYNFADFKYDPSSFSTDVFTNPATSRVFSDVFGGSQSYTFPEWGSGSLSPESINRSFGYSSPVSSRSSDQDFNVGKAIEAVSKSLERLGSSTPGVQRNIKGTVSGAQLVGEGRGYRLYEREPDVKETRKAGGGGGLFGAIGGIAGPLLAATPFFGPLAVPIAAGVGRGIDAAAGT